MAEQNKDEWIKLEKEIEFPRSKVAHCKSMGGTVPTLSSLRFHPRGEGATDSIRDLIAVEMQRQESATIIINDQM